MSALREPLWLTQGDSAYRGEPTARQLHQVALDKAEAVIDCRRCHGQGRWCDDYCHECHGTGKQPATRAEWEREELFGNALDGLAEWVTELAKVERFARFGVELDALIGRMVRALRDERAREKEAA